MKPYYSVLTFTNGVWSVQFGDYDQDVAGDELQEYKDKGEKAQLICTGDTQAEIDQYVKLANETAARIRMEKRIVKSLVTELSTKGLLMTIDHGDGDELDRTGDVKQVLSVLLQCDEENLRVYSKEGWFMGVFNLVYGNDGYDVICDHTMQLEQYIPETLALIEKLGG